MYGFGQSRDAVESVMGTDARQVDREDSHHLTPRAGLSTIISDLCSIFTLQSLDSCVVR
ncbi:hypothetical protein BD413DRAFT_537942 [Trametes elegans]|nr:hypothetical protein BD413DRAFT_537942 [Trametes elegans]